MFLRVHRWAVGAVMACLCLGHVSLHAQEFKLLDRTVQVHGFASQGFVYTNENNWLTMNTSGGSGAFTDFGLNLSAPITDRLRVGAQGYDRNLGQLGQYHPSLDWAVADYRFQSWLGFRGGKVKTTLGLFNDCQDQDFLHTFALLPQSVYPTDLRDATIAHVGGDFYGTIFLPRRLGDLSYTAYAGHRSDSIYSGYPYLLSGFGTHFTSFGGLQYGGDLRWNPRTGLVLGASRLDQDTKGKGTALNPADLAAPRIPYSESSRADWMNQYYGEYAVGKARISSEYRRYVRDQLLFGGNSRNLTDVRGWYVLGSYRVAKRLDLGAYYSHYAITSILGGALAQFDPSQTDTSLPANHIYDKVVTGRILLRKYWDAKIEGHFMDGYGSSTYPDGFYLQVNANGFKPKTNALVVKTSFSF